MPDGGSRGTTPGPTSKRISTIPVAVCDSSVLIHLAAIGQFGLLQRFFDTIVIPPAVWREVVEEGQGMSGSRETAEGVQAGRVAIQAPADRSLVSILARELHPGEAEALAPAAGGCGDIALVDETDARRAADSLGPRKTGTVGLLMRARREGSVTSLGAELERLRGEGGFRIDDDLYHLALASVGEDAE